MIQQIPEFLKGQLLLAMPGLVDPNFSQTVTCFFEHSEQGAVGGHCEPGPSALVC